MRLGEKHYRSAWFLLWMLVIVLGTGPRLVTALHVNLAFHAQAKAFLTPGFSLDDRLSLLKVADQWLSQGANRGQIDQRLLSYLRSMEVVLHQTKRDAAVARMAFREGRRMEAMGNLGQASEYYREAIQRDRHSTAALLELGLLYREQGETKALLAIEQELASLIPTHPVSMTVADSLVLLGYDVDEEAFAFDVPMTIVLYWEIRGKDLQASANLIKRQIDHEGWLTYQVGSRLYQIGEVANLIWNAGFEHPSLWSQGTPPGFTEGHTYRTPFAYSVLLLERDGLGTSAGCVQNTVQRTRGGLTSPIFSVLPGRLYLIGGWVRESDNGAARIFARNLAKRSYLSNIKDVFLTKRFSHDDWAYFGGATFFSGSGPSYASLWADNVGIGSLVCFDNLLLAALPAVPVFEDR